MHISIIQLWDIHDLIQVYMIHDNMDIHNLIIYAPNSVMDINYFPAHRSGYPELNHAYPYMIVDFEYYWIVNLYP